MSLAPGQRLGPYEVVAPLGAGGMGEVWRARDTRLGREVAIKVLPAAVATDPALRARIEREARTISSLNHPHICTLHDIGREGETDYLVLELVEGETLALRLARGPLPTSEVLRYGIQIADALERAHRAGIVHRDLKPGNIMLTRSGAKLLDFGLARGGGPGAEEAGQRTLSPTMAEPLTQAGHIVGTFQYMAPEQLEGAEPDPRSDLWALGCVLYEMATGKAPFTGGSQASLISSIMKDEPRAIGEVAPLSPPALERVVRQCLAKDPEERWQTAGDLRRELAWISSSGSQASVAAVAGFTTAMPRRLTLGRVFRTWILPAVLGALVAAVIGRWASGRGAPDGPTRLTIVHGTMRPFFTDPFNMALSPDGQAIAYVYADSTAWKLFVRPLDELEPRLLATSKTSIENPFWSPDSRHLAYFTTGEDGRLWRVPREGGNARPLAPSTNGRGGTWNRKGVILFAPEPRGPLFRVPASGGDVVQVTHLDSAAGQVWHRNPRFLPDGNHFLFSGRPTKGGVDIYAGSLSSRETERLFTRETGVVYAKPGYLLFNQEGRLLAQPFDDRARKIRGEPFVIAEATDLTDAAGGANVTASDNGRLAWMPSPATRTRVEWVDRAGQSLETIDTFEGGIGKIALSREGRRALLAVNRPTGTVEIHHHDPARGGTQRVTPAGVRSYEPVWTPDERGFYMTSAPAGNHQIYLQSPLTSTKPVLVPAGDQPFLRPRSVTPDGRWLLFIALNPATGWDLYRLELGAGRPPEPILDDAGQVDARLSPDGRVLAVRSDMGGRERVFVAPWSDPTDLRQVTTPISVRTLAWNRDGTELFFDMQEGSQFVIASVAIDPVTATPRGPIRALVRRSRLQGWAPSPDGKRFLIGTAGEETLPNLIQVDLDWTKLARAQ